MKTQSKWLWLIGLGVLAGLAIWKLTKKVSAAQVKTTLTPDAQTIIASVQKTIAATGTTTIPASQIGTTDDPNADANAQKIYAKLATILPVGTPVAANGMTATQLLNIHALVATPEQIKWGAIPLASNWTPAIPGTISPTATIEDVVNMLERRIFPIYIPAPVRVPSGALPFYDGITGEVYGFSTYPWWTYGGYMSFYSTDVTVHQIDPNDLAHPGNVGTGYPKGYLPSPIIPADAKYVIFSYDPEVIIGYVSVNNVPIIDRRVVWENPFNIPG